MARLKYHQTILKILGEDHLTADDIYDIMRKKYGRIGIATIYRTLEHLVETKEVTKLVGVFDKAYFEKNKWPHMHFVDKLAYRIIDVPVSNYDFLPKQEWFSISYADIVVYGTVWDSIASGLFSPQEEWNTIAVDENLNEISSLPQAADEDILMPLSDKEVEVSIDNENEPKTILDDIGTSEDVLDASPVFSNPSDTGNSPSITENTSPQEDVDQKQQEEEKKKRRELKNIFRQF